MAWGKVASGLVGFLGFVCFAGLALGCQHDVSTPFPPGLEPLEKDTAPPPAATPSDPYPQAINIQPGTDDTSPYVHATGYIKGNISDVWSAMQDPAVVVDRHHVDSWTAAQNVETGYDVSFRTDYTVHNIVTVNFSLTWREGAVDGTKDAPSHVSIVYEKTFGSSYINMMKGSIELVKVTDGVTELQFAQRLDASQTDQNTIVMWTQGIYDSVIARLAGQPLP
jgi:hypothetical protein